MSTGVENGYSSIPREEGETDSANVSVHRIEDDSLGSKFRKWWAFHWGTSDTAPLLNRYRMTLEPPRKSNLRIAFEIVAIVGLSTLFAAVVIYFLLAQMILEVIMKCVRTFKIHAKHKNVGFPTRKLTSAEKMMLDLPSAKRLRHYLQSYTAEPHLAGTKADKKQAEWTRAKFTEFGIPNAEIKTYYPLLNYPVSHRLALVSGPEELRYTATLKEKRIEEDPSTENPDIVPLFHGRCVQFI